MENNNLDNPKNDADDDKTIIYSSAVKSTPDDKSDKTTVSIDAEKTQVINTQGPDKKEEPKPESNRESPIQQNKEILKNMKKENKISTGAFAAGVAGAGIAGAALGTVFSDEIKDVFNVESSDTPVTPYDSTTEVTPDPNDTGSILTGLINTPDDNQPIMPEGFSTIEVSGTDNEGNVYAVSLMDLDGDGTADLETGDIHLVDGTSISYLQTEGGAVFTVFDPSQLAAPEEYPGGYITLEQTTYSYEIQPGDTLSEIAAANNTSIEHIMELNPDILNPNEIYAYSQLVIPTDNNIIDPYQLDDSVNGPEMFLAEATEIPVSVDAPVESGEGNFEAVDWGSFSDEPLTYDDSEYGNALAQTDFDNYETPDSYVDYSYLEFGNDFVSSEFM